MCLCEGVCHDDPLVFTTSQWQAGREPNIFYWAYRLVIVIYFSITLGLAFHDMDTIQLFVNSTAQTLCDPSITYINYLTRATFVIVLLQAALVLILVSISAVFYLVYKEMLDFKSTHLRLTCFFYWMLNIAATDIIFTQQFCFWHKVYKVHQSYSLIYDHDDVGKHFFLFGSNTIFIVIDFFLVAHPVDLNLFWVPIIFGKLPIAVTFCSVYFSRFSDYCDELFPYLGNEVTRAESFGGKTLYLIGYTFGGGFTIILTHFIFFGFYKLRLYLHSILCQKRECVDSNRNDKALSDNI